MFFASNNLISDNSPESYLFFINLKCASDAFIDFSKTSILKNDVSASITDPLIFELSSCFNKFNLVICARRRALWD